MTHYRVGETPAKTPSWALARNPAGANYIHHIHQETIHHSYVGLRLQHTKWDAGRNELASLLAQQRAKEQAVLQLIISSAPDWEDLLIAAFGNNPPTDAHGNLITNGVIESRRMQYEAALAWARADSSSVESGVDFLNELIKFELETSVPFTDDEDSLAEARAMAERVIYSAMGGVSGKSFSKKTFKEMGKRERNAFIKGLAEAASLIESEYQKAANLAAEDPVQQFAAYLLARGLRFIMEQHDAYAGQVNADVKTKIKPKSDVGGFKAALARAGITMRTKAATSSRQRENRTAEEVFTKGAIKSIRGTKYTMEGKLGEVVGSHITRRVINHFSAVPGMTFKGSTFKSSRPKSEGSSNEPDYEVHMNIGFTGGNTTGADQAQASLSFGITAEGMSDELGVNIQDIKRFGLGPGGMSGVGGLGEEFNFFHDPRISYLLVNALYHNWGDVISNFEEALSAAGSVYLIKQISSRAENMTRRSSSFMITGGRLIAMSQVLEKMYQAINARGGELVDATINRVAPDPRRLIGLKYNYPNRYPKEPYYSPGWVSNVAEGYGDYFLSSHSVSLIFQKELLRWL